MAALWHDKNASTPRRRNPQVSLVWLGASEHILALNSNDELMLARINPAGFDRFAIARRDAEWVCVELVSAHSGEMK